MIANIRNPDQVFSGTRWPDRVSLRFFAVL